MKRAVFLAIILVLISLLVVVGCSRPETSAKPEEFYKGKTITIIVPYSPGGGYDITARLFGPYLAKYTGAANVVVENMAGAGGIKGMNHMYTTAQPDGLTLATFPGDTTMLNQLLSVPEVRYNVTNYSYIGRFNREDEALALGAKVPYTAPKDLQAMKELKMGTSLVVSGISFTTAAFANVFDLNTMKMIPGYASAKEIILAVASGELHGVGTDIATLKTYADQGILKLVCSLTQDRSPESPNVPTIYELAKQVGITIKGDKAKWLDLRLATLDLRRELVGPPNIPKDRVTFLRDAFMKAAQDKEFQAAMEKGGYPVRGIGKGEDLQAAAGFKMTDADLAAFKTLLTEKYIKK